MPSIMVAKPDGVVLLHVELDPRCNYLIGRSPRANIRLNATSVSRRHALLFHHDDEWFITDLGSTRGLHDANGAVSLRQLKDGEWISVGPAALWYRDERPDRENRVYPEATAEAAFLDVFRIEGPGDNLPMTLSPGSRTNLSIGESDSCDISTPGIGLRDLHAILYLSASHWHAVALGAADLNSNNDSDSSGSTTVLLEVEVPLQIGPITLFLQQIRHTHAVISSAFDEHNAFENDELDLGVIDLNAAAQSSPSKRPTRPSH